MGCFTLMGLGTSSRASGRLQNVLLAALALLQLGSFNWSKPNPTAPHCDVGTGSSFKAMESGIIKVGEAQVHTQSPYFSSTVAGLTLPNYFSGNLKWEIKILHTNSSLSAKTSYTSLPVNILIR